MTLLSKLAGYHEKVLRPHGGCHNCPRGRVAFVPATLRAGAVLFVGEAPGETDAVEGESFAGRGGQLLRRISAECGVPQPWSFTSTIHCRPPENTPPKKKEIDCCLAQFVLGEITGYPVVVLCGNVPLNALFPEANVTHFRGNVAHHPDFPGQRFFSTYHPSYILRRPDLEAEFAAHLARLARIVREAGVVPTWTTVVGGQAIDRLREIISTQMLVALDLETTGLEPWVPGAAIRSICIAPSEHEAVVVFADDPHFVAALELVRTLLLDPSKAVVGRNVAFDVHWLAYELDLTAVCQLYELGSIWFYARQYQAVSLKELVSRERDGYRYLVHKPHLCKDSTLLGRYNAEDGVHSYGLLRPGMARLQPTTRELVARILGPASLIFRQMTANGLYLRQDYWREQIDAYAAERRAVVAAWAEEDRAFIPVEHESGYGLRHYIFDVLKCPPLHLTDKGTEPAIDAVAIKQWIRDGFTPLQHLLKLREIDKVESTYLTPYKEHVWPDSRIRSQYWMDRTDSGRTSSSNPNLQNIPRLKRIRNLFGVPPGSVLAESDLSQIEFRIMVCLAKDHAGIDGYLRGEDAHTMTARAIAGPDATKEHRTLAKPVNFSLLYGGNADGVQRYALNTYGVEWSRVQAKAFTDAFFSLYRSLPVFHDNARAVLRQRRGWFTSVLGHVFFYKDWDHKNQGQREHAERSALNAEAQGPAAQLCFYIMVLARQLLDARGFRTVRFVNHVHDSILTEIPKPAWVADVLATIDEAARQVHAWARPWFVVPLIMEHAIGDAWGNLTPYQK